MKDDRIADDRLDNVLQVDRGLELLAEVDPLGAGLIKLRYFVGLKRGHTADALGIGRRNADWVWTYAKAWLQAESRKRAALRL